jgi:hypothetical protein
MNEPNLRLLGKEEEKILRRIPSEIFSLALILALGSLFFYDWTIGLLILAGGILAAGNFVWMKQALTRLLVSGKHKALRSGIALYALRLLLILAIFFIIILFFSTKIIAFAAGFSTIILVFLVEAIRGLFRLKKWTH